MAYGIVERRASFLPYLVVVAMLGAVPSFVSFSNTRSRRPSVSRADGAGAIERWDKTGRWQHTLDKVVLDFDASVPEKVSGIQSMWKHRKEVVDTVVGAALLVRERGPSARMEVLDALFPRGTFARADIDSIIALINSVRRQLPDVAQELEELRMYLERITNRVAPMPKELQNLRDEAIKRVLPIGVDMAPESAADVFREIQSQEKEEVSYLVVKETKDYEVRVYQPYTLVKKTSDKMGQAFSDLASYLKKQKKHTQTMKVALPVSVEYSASSPHHSARAMSFVLDSKADVAEVEKDPSIPIVRVPMQYMAVRTVIGSTDAEVQAQLKELHATLKAEGLYEPVVENQYNVFQYYSPRAALWRRRTEVAVPVKPVRG